MYVMSANTQVLILSYYSANFLQVYTDSSLNCLLGHEFQTLIILVILHQMISPYLTQYTY